MTTDKTQIRAVVFDYGNVLSRPQDPSQIELLTTLTGLPAEEFARRYVQNRLAYDRGFLTGSEYWTELLNGTEAPAPQLIDELIQTDVASWLHLDERLVAWAHGLRTAKVSLAILSNMPVDVLAGLRRTQGARLEEFAATIFSCEVACVKPEAKIYLRLLDALDLSGSQVLFVDDVRENVEGASQVGLHAVHYHSFEELKQEVQGRFGLCLPESQDGIRLTRTGAGGA